MAAVAEVQVDSNEFEAIERCLRSAEKASASCKRKLPLSPLPCAANSSSTLQRPGGSTAVADSKTLPQPQQSAAYEVPSHEPPGANAPSKGRRRVPPSLLRSQPDFCGPSTKAKPAALCPGHTAASCQIIAPQQPWCTGLNSSSSSSSSSGAHLQPLCYCGHIVYAATAAAVDAACSQVLQPGGPRVVGLDIEWCARYIRGQAPDPTALLQICYCCGAGGDAAPAVDGRGTICLLLHVWHSGMTPLLQELLQRQDIAKTGVGIRGDAMKLHSDFGFEVQAVVELSDEANRRVLAALPQVTASMETRRWSLADLAAEVLRLTLNKSQGLRVSDWGRRPLPAHQQQYAACDAFASLALHWALHSRPLRQPGATTAGAVVG